MTADATPTPAPLALRPEVAAFAQAMESQLRKHDATRGKRGWQNDYPQPLMQRLRQEADELDTVLLLGLSPNKPAMALAEAADVANFAMMVADVCGGLTATPAPAPTAPAQPPVASCLVCGHERTLVRWVDTNPGVAGLCEFCNWGAMGVQAAPTPPTPTGGAQPEADEATGSGRE